MKHLLFSCIHFYKNYQKYLKSSEINASSYLQSRYSISRKLKIYITHPQYAYRLGRLKTKSSLASVAYRLSRIVRVGEQHKY